MHVLCLYIEAAVSETGRGSTPDSIGSSGSRQVSSGFDSGGQQQSSFQPPASSSSQQPPQQQLPTSQGYQPSEQPPPQSVQPYQQQGNVTSGRNLMLQLLKLCHYFSWTDLTVEIKYCIFNHILFLYKSLLEFYFHHFSFIVQASLLRAMK